MPKFSLSQRSFSTGEVSPYIHSRADVDAYYSAVARLENFIVDQHGSIHRRPGTEHRAKAKGKPCLYSFAAGDDVDTVIVATPNCFQFFVDGNHVGDDLDAPYGEDDYCDLKMVDDCGVTFITHPDYPPMFLQHLDGEYTLNEFPRLPYGPINDQQSCKLCLSEGGSAGEGQSTLQTDIDLNVGDVVDVVDVDGVLRGQVTVEAALGAGAYSVTYLGVPSGEYRDINGNTIALTTAGATLKAQGCEPFTEDMVSQYIRILDEEGVCAQTAIEEVATTRYEFVGVDRAAIAEYARIDGEYIKITSDAVFDTAVPQFNLVTETTSRSVEVDSNDPNTWVSVQVIKYVSASEVIVAYSGCKLKCTDLFCLPAYGDGNYPSSAWIFQDRLWLANQNQIVGSATGNFFDWEKTDNHGSVNPDNAVYAKIDAGQCNDIQWMRNLNQYLVIGTDAGVYALGGESGGIQADSVAQQLIQSIGVSHVDPVNVQDQVLFVDRTCRRIYSLAPGAQYDQIALIEHTIFADHITEAGIKKLAFQETPFPIVWVVLENGCLASFTYWPNQSVRGWSRHTLGGQLVKYGWCEKPNVCDVEVNETADGKGDQVYFAVKRTVNSEDIFTIETLGDFFSHKTKKEDAHYLDGAVRLGDAVALGLADGWHDPRLLLPGYSGRVAICDNERWYYGDSDGEYVTLHTPNTNIVRSGRTMVERNDDWELLEKPKYNVKQEFIGVSCCLFDPPCGDLQISDCRDEWSGFECMEGETLVVYSDGCDDGCVEVTASKIKAQACIGWAGYPYISEVETLPWRANLGGTDGSNDASAAVRVSVNLYRTPSLEAVVGKRDNYHQVMENCRDVVRAQSTDIWGVEFFTGWADVPLPTKYNRNDEAGFMLRARGPYPAIIRSIEVQFLANGGQ